ncbi:sugar phosphate nucleotidyltransferase [Methanobrevibacter oralis]|uniref:sugar phosphate nucleotidyltransferase n=1 Tax=Methanobrevibacter oralis TaxID=66851 RepID=UPI0005B2B750|nr:sugar phosphate nucleotidyltransferase [Methanobrevibacter oralis]
MISVILSAGMGTRLMPLTKNIPKPLLELNRTTLLERMIKNCIAIDIKEFIAVVGYNKDKVIDLAGKLEKNMISILKLLKTPNMT